MRHVYIVVLSQIPHGIPGLRDAFNLQGGSLKWSIVARTRHSRILLRVLFSFAQFSRPSLPAKSKFPASSVQYDLSWQLEPWSPSPQKPDTKPSKSSRSQRQHLTGCLIEVCIYCTLKAYRGGSHVSRFLPHRFRYLDVFR